MKQNQNKIKFIVCNFDKHVLVYIVHIVVGDSLSSFSCKHQYKNIRYYKRISLT